MGAHWTSIDATTSTRVYYISISIYNHKAKKRTADAPEHEPQDEAEEADPDVAFCAPAPAVGWCCVGDGRMDG